MSTEMKCFMRGFIWMTRRVLYMFMGMLTMIYLGITFVVFFFLPPLSIFMIAVFGVFFFYLDLRYHLFGGR